MTTQPNGREWNLGYRPALDGLRGVAVLLVILQHAQVTPFERLGTTGVTLFFVLSGFLITTLLLDEMRRSGAIDVLAFYGRRARRLLPALGLFLTAMAVVGLGASVVVPAALYYANWHFTWAEYPDQLAHLWTLSVEEQFYILWPLALVVLVRIPRRAAMSLLVVAIVAMGVSRIGFHLAGAAHEWIFYATQHRADALLAGCLLAFAFERRPWLPSRRTAVVGVACIAFAATIHQSVAVATIALPLATFGAVVLVASCAVQAPRSLSGQPLVYIGTISYGLYLWHFPILWPAIGTWWIWAAIAASIVVAAASHHYLERPILRWKPSRGSQLAARASEPFPSP